MSTSAAFYDAVLVAVGGTRVMDFGETFGYGVPPMPDFWLGQRQTGDGFARGNNVEAVCHLPK